MLLFNRRGSHAILSFVASGHVLFLDARKRTPLACIDVGAQAHAAVPAPDESYVVVANQNGKLVQRIRTDYRTNTFALEPDATLDLGPLEDPALRPDNAPICPLIDSSSRLAFVTLRGGGMFVARQPRDADADHRLLRQDDDPRQRVRRVESGGRMYVNSGGGTAANLSEFDVYAFNLAEFRNAAGTGSCAGPAPNLPAPKLVVSQDDRDADSHGAVLTGEGRYLWVADRSGNRIVVISTATDQVVGEISLVGQAQRRPVAGPARRLTARRSRLRLTARQAAAVRRSARVDREHAGRRRDRGQARRPIRAPDRDRPDRERRRGRCRPRRPARAAGDGALAEQPARLVELELVTAAVAVGASCWLAAAVPAATSATAAAATAAIVKRRMVIGWSSLS